MNALSMEKQFVLKARAKRHEFLQRIRRLRFDEGGTKRSVYIARAQVLEAAVEQVMAGPMLVDGVVQPLVCASLLAELRTLVDQANEYRWGTRGAPFEYRMFSAADVVFESMVWGALPPCISCFRY